MRGTRIGQPCNLLLWYSRGLQALDVCCCEKSDWCTQQLNGRNSHGMSTPTTPSLYASLSWAWVRPTRLWTLYVNAPSSICRKPWWGRLPLIYPSECRLSSASEVKTVFVLFYRASSNPPTTIWPSRQWCKLHLVFVFLTKSAYLKSAFVAAVFPKNKKVLSYISTRLTNESIVKWRWIWKTWSILTE